MKYFILSYSDIGCTFVSNRLSRVTRETAEPVSLYLYDFGLDFPDGLLERLQVRGPRVVHVHDEDPWVNVEDVAELVQGAGED